MRKSIFVIGPALVAIGLMVAVLSPLRQRLQFRFAQIGREVLATAEGDALNDGGTAKVIKYKSRDGIFVEILKETAAGEEPTLVERILLPDKHDGLFNYQGHITRLAIADVNHDGQQMLLAPTFDAQLIPHLNVFRYNKDLHRFEPYSPEAK